MATSVATMREVVAPTLPPALSPVTHDAAWEERHQYALNALGLLIDEADAVNIIRLPDGSPIVVCAMPPREVDA